jgi:hypothetical protein
MEQLSEDIRRELSAGEQFHWWGRPRQGVILRSADVFLIPFSSLWCGFAIFWEISVLRMPDSPRFFALWGIPFVVVGVYFVVGRFLVEARERSRTFYAVTSERVLIVAGLFRPTVTSLNLRTLSDLSLSAKNSGEGSISFGGQRPVASLFGGMGGWPGSQWPPPRGRASAGQLRREAS